MPDSAHPLSEIFVSVYIQYQEPMMGSYKYTLGTSYISIFFFID